MPIQESDKPLTAFEANGRLYQFRRIPFGVTNGVAVFQRVVDSIIEDHGLTGTYAYLDNVTVAGKTQEQHDKNVKKFLTTVKDRNLTLNHDKTVASVKTIKVLGYEVSNGLIKPDPDRLSPLEEL